MSNTVASEMLDRLHEEVKKLDALLQPDVRDPDFEPWCQMFFWRWYNIVRLWDETDRQYPQMPDDLNRYLQGEGEDKKT